MAIRFDFLDLHHLVNQDSSFKGRLLSYTYLFMIMITLIALFDSNIASSSRTDNNHHINYLRLVRNKTSLERREYCMIIAAKSFCFLLSCLSKQGNTCEFITFVWSPMSVISSKFIAQHGDICLRIKLSLPNNVCSSIEPECSKKCVKLETKQY
ncbi:unnamed protein product [Albugo candida]|uniref:Uncharacterized protein n=1 Tax=Albugo candida TaxID=65357 RepID=A0A024FU40_9STRA|nr:unnamed protein product [Albugo candida]|eukprot:CCI10668.1 unnamed protein product [Albugo candida]